MPRISLVAYTVTVKVKNSKADYQNLDDIDGHDLLSKIELYINKHKLIKQGDFWKGDLYNDKNDQKTFGLQQINKNTTDRTITGQFLTGNYGYGSSLIDVNSNQTSYDRKPDDTECLPIYFMFSLPTTTHGLLILEQFGQLGIKKILQDVINSQFRYDFDGYVLEIRPLVQKDLIINYLQKGYINKFSFIGFKPPKGLEEKHHNNHNDEIKYYDFTVHAKKGHNLNWFMPDYVKALKGEKNIKDMFAIQDFELNDIKAEFSIAGRKKTIRLTQANELYGDYDITSQVKINASGHPIYESIDKMAKDYLKTLNLSNVKTVDNGEENDDTPD